MTSNGTCILALLTICKVLKVFDVINSQGQTLRLFINAKQNTFSDTQCDIEAELIEETSFLRILSGYYLHA